MFDNTLNATSHIVVIIIMLSESGQSRYYMLLEEGTSLKMVGGICEQLKITYHYHQQ